MGMIQHIEQPIEAGRRSHSRLRVRLPARLVTVTGARELILFDLGQFGARLLISEPIAPGISAMLYWGAFEAFGQVAWCRSGYCGVSFEEELAAKTLIATRDLDDVAHLHRADDMDRRAAKAWSQGGA